MKLASYMRDGAPGLGIVEDGRLYPAPSGAPDTLPALVAAGPSALDQLGSSWGALGSAAARAKSSAVEEVELLAPLPRPGKIVAIGLNYHDHAREGGREAPERPLIFAKFATSVIGPGATIEWDPELTSQVDFEAELAVVVGREARRVSESNALDYVFGYTCLNDVSARDLQYADKQFVRSKSLDTFCPMGPWVVTADEVPDPQTLGISCTVSGARLQDSTTADMVFPVAELIAFCSRAFTLEPGDVIATGTPAGVGFFREPKRLLRDGDEVVVEIERIGQLSNRCRERRSGAEELAQDLG